MGIDCDGHAPESRTPCEHMTERRLCGGMPCGKNPGVSLPMFSAAWILCAPGVGLQFGVLEHSPSSCIKAGGDPTYFLLLGIRDTVSVPGELGVSTALLGRTRRVLLLSCFHSPGCGVGG